MSGPKFIPGVEGSETDGEPSEDVMTEYGDASPFMGEPRVLMGDGRGLEVLMTEGCPPMPIGWWWEWAVFIGPEESVGEEQREKVVGVATNDSQTRTHKAVDG